MNNNELARLFRPKPPEFFPSKSIIATLDKENNLVCYREDIFESLPKLAKRAIFQLQESFLELTTIEPEEVDPFSHWK